MKPSKKHLYPVFETMLCLDVNENVDVYSFICPTKQDAIQCRNNVQNTILKGVLKHKFKTQVVNSVDLDGHVLWFLVVTKL